MVNSQLTSVFSGTICRSRMATAKTRAISNQARGDNLARSAGLQSGMSDTAPIFEIMGFPGRGRPHANGSALTRYFQMVAGGCAAESVCERLVPQEGFEPPTPSLRMLGRAFSTVAARLRTR